MCRSVPGEGTGDTGHQELALEGALSQQFLVEGKGCTGAGTVLDLSLPDHLHVKV